MSLLNEVCSEASLHRSLVKILSKTSSNRLLGQIQADPVGEIAKISSELLSDDYEFNYLGFLIPQERFTLSENVWPELNPDPAISKLRGVTTISDKDRIVQLSMLRTLDDHIGPKITNEISYGQKRRAGEDGKAIQDLANRLGKARKEKRASILRIDIEKFFPSIDREILNSQLSFYLPDQSLSNLITKFLSGKMRFADGVEPEQKEIFWKNERGVPQGTLLASLLSSLYLHEFDLWLSEKELTAFRYVDDLVIVCDSGDPSSLYFEIKERLGVLNLSIPELGDQQTSKCSIISPDSDLEVVGFRITPEGKIFPSKGGEERIVRKFVLSFLNKEEQFLDGFSKNSYIASQRITSFHRVFSPVVRSKKYWGEFDKRISICASRIAGKSEALRRMKFHQNRRECITFMGVPRLANEPLSPMVRMRYDEAEALLNDYYAGGMFDVE